MKEFSKLNKHANAKDGGNIETTYLNVPKFRFDF